MSAADSVKAVRKRQPACDEDDDETWARDDDDVDSYFY